MVSSFWSLNPEHSFIIGLRLLLTFAGAMLFLNAARSLPPPQAERLCTILLISAGLFLVLFGLTTGKNSLMFQLLHDPARFHTDDDKGRFNTGMAILALISWAFLVVVAKRFGMRLATLMLVAVLVILFFAMTRAVFLAFGLGMVGAIATYILGRRPLAIIFLSLAGIVFLMPFFLSLLFKIEFFRSIDKASLEYVEWSTMHRLLIWKFAITRFWEHPWLGWGMDVSRFLPGGNEPAVTWIQGSELLPLHPHNGALQIWLELGWGGALLTVACLLSTWRLLTKLEKGRIWLAAATGAIITFFLLSLLSFGIWQSWWQTTLCFAFTLLVLAGRPPENRAPNGAML